MAKDGLTTRPWYHWCPRDFMCDHAVIAMSREQRWLYRDALDLSWLSTTPGVEYESQWREWLGVTPAEWPAVRDRFAAAFVVFGDVWVQRHLLADWDTATSISRSRSVSGRKGQQVVGNSSANASNSSANASNSSANADGCRAVALRVESREVETKESKTLSASADARRDWTEFFESNVWPHRPRKGAPGPYASESHKAAAARWAKIEPKTTENANRIADALEADVAALRAEGREASRCPHLVTWLNQERWEDAS